VFDHYDSLTELDQQNLTTQLESIDLKNLQAIYNSAMEQHTSSSSTPSFMPFNGSSASSYPNPLTATTQENINLYRKLGLEAIKAKKVAAVLLSGGQGTRLGFDGPKGCFDIDLPSGKCLFQIMIEKTIRLAKLANSQFEIPWYIMTSPMNHEAHVTFFSKNNYFGLSSSSVQFFVQGVLPCLTSEGKIMLKSAKEINFAPDGNGGIYSAMINNNILVDLQEKQIDFVHAFAVDNLLVKVCDPVFVGYCIDQKVEVGNKCLWKRDADEKVGVVMERADGRPCVIEYSDMSDSMKRLTDEKTGRLVHGAGNICNHFYTTKFLTEVVAVNLGDMYHIAKKKIPYVSADGKHTINPESVNGLKLESFIFDCFPLSQRMAVLDVERWDEFAPVKNADIETEVVSDSPTSARLMWSEMCKRWCVESEIDPDKFTTGGVCDISPLTSYGGEGL